MKFVEFLNALVEAGTGGKIFAVIIISVTFVWLCKIFLIPFYISNINTKIGDIDNKISDIEKYIKQEKAKKYEE